MSGVISWRRRRFRVRALLVNYSAAVNKWRKWRVEAFSVPANAARRLKTLLSIKAIRRRLSSSSIFFILYRRFSPSSDTLLMMEVMLVLHPSHIWADPEAEQEMDNTRCCLRGQQRAASHARPWLTLADLGAPGNLRVRRET